MNTMVITKYVGAICGSLLVFLLINTASEMIFDTHSEEVAFIVETPDAGGGESAAPAEAVDFDAHVARADVLYWFAILVAVNLQTSFLTPPFGFALFYLKGVAPNSVKIQNIYRGIVPFVALQVMGLVAVMIWPQIALWLPSVILD